MECHLLVVTDDISLRKALIREIVQQTGIEWRVYGLGDDISALADTTILWVLLDLRVSEENLYAALDVLRKVAISVRYATIYQSQSGENKLVEWLNPEITADDLDDLPTILFQIVEQQSQFHEKVDSSIDQRMDMGRLSEPQRFPVNLSMPVPFHLHRDGDLAVGDEIVPDAAALLKGTLLEMKDKVENREVLRYVSLWAGSEKYMIYGVDTNTGLVGAVFNKGTPVLKARRAVHQLVDFIVHGGALADAPRHLFDQLDSLANETNAEEPSLDEGGVSSELARIFEDELIPPEPDNFKQTKTEKITNMTAMDADPVLQEGEHSGTDFNFGGTAKSPVTMAGESDVVHTNALQYHFVLITRFPEDTIDDSLASMIVRWAREISLSYGWRLNSIDIHGGILQWEATALASIAPGEIAQQMRTNLSQRIMRYFPHYRENNPGGDFWAPGFFVSSGDDKPVEAELKRFVENTRKNQGLIG